MTLQLRADAYYRRRDGAIVGPLKTNPQGPHRWIVADEVYMDNGRVADYSTTAIDLVAEVIVTDVAPVTTDATAPTRITRSLRETDEVETARMALLSTLTAAVGYRQNTAVFDALETYVSARLDYLRSDLTDSINQTGLHSPHW